MCGYNNKTKNRLLPSNCHIMFKINSNIFTHSSNARSFRRALLKKAACSPGALVCRSGRPVYVSGSRQGHDTVAVAIASWWRKWTLQTQRRLAISSRPVGRPALPAICASAEVLASFIWRSEGCVQCNNQRSCFDRPLHPPQETSRAITRTGRFRDGFQMAAA